MTLINDRTARTDVPVLDVIANRWSPRLYDPHSPVDEDALRSALEAARWAPSAYNRQPWRFLVTRRGSSAHETVLNSLIDVNQGWAKDAGALVVVLTETVGEDGSPLPEARYDAGQAAAYFTIQAHANDLLVHQMSGFDPVAVAQAFSLDEDLVPLTVIAVGVPGDAGDADDAVLARENAPRTRRPLVESVLVND
ncbi:nitroreductase family protein [Corynebacterium glyciniphilum]|uniref:nitroreductase family protein n=1 Tax=Corynebacterium glyciniphilum TaxID=1404244 RepID=UPI0016432524|nr:nitroreductase family protein [Corynebacterium glyciniphilum]